MRTYIRRRLGDGALATAAYSLDSVLIELVFIVGPLLVAIFLTVASATVAVLFSAACALAGTLTFLQSPAVSAWRTSVAPQRTGYLGPLRTRRFRALVGVILCYSIAFGMSEIGVTARATEMGHPALAGLLLGIMSAGSACGGLAYGSRSWHAPLSRQFAALLAIMSFGLASLALEWAPGMFAVLCALAGVVMAPALIVQSMLVASNAHADHLTEAFTWSASALLAGIGAGFAIGGLLLERLSATAPFVAGAVSALLASLVALFALRKGSS